MSTAKHGDDIATVAAIAVLAACIATVAHEAVGHGLTCLALGGDIAQLTSVYFQCSVPSTAIAAGGPIGNLVAAALCFWLFSRTSANATRTRLLLLLTMAFGIFWFAGYLGYSAARQTGDLYFVARDLFGEPSFALRIGAIIVAMMLYFVGVAATRQLTGQLSRDPKRIRRLLYLAWIFASLSAIAAALTYAPDRIGAALQAALEIGAASLPLLTRGVVAPVGANEPTPIISRSLPWLIASVTAFALFVATLGHGVPY
ncbi:MAG: hypothetical protein NT015_18390 [Alphaproteobacteria bacterium]|nr:hypothetical protein [Alphaproteobacteria bacterium]